MYVLNVAFRHYASVKPNVTTYINTKPKRFARAQIQKSKPLLKIKTHYQEAQRGFDKPETASSLPSQEETRESRAMRIPLLSFSPNWISQSVCVPAFCGNRCSDK